MTISNSKPLFLTMESEVDVGLYSAIDNCIVSRSKGDERDQLKIIDCFLK